MISKQVAKAIEEGTWIRRMFMTAQKLYEEHGKENVFDLSIGNPTLEPPAEVKTALKELLESDETGLHRYMPAKGLEKTREFLSKTLHKEYNLKFETRNILMCVGAAGGINITLKTLLNPEDEVIALSPYFLEYKAYVENHGGTFKVIKTDPQFHLDLEALEENLGDKTKALILNSPNNPSGAMYTRKELEGLSDILTKFSEKTKKPIYIISDEPYAKIVYDSKRYNAPVEVYKNTIVVSSFSKTLGIPGERLGYVAISPHCENANEISDGSAWSQVALGYVNAPAIWQHALPKIGDVSINMELYENNRKKLCDLFDNAGVEYTKPEGAFYFFPKCPKGINDLELVEIGIKNLVIMVPGRGFGCPNYVRISYCFDTPFIERAIEKLSLVFSN